MTQQAVFDVALADFRKESRDAIYQRDLMVVNQREMARLEMAAEQDHEVMGDSNATIRAALKAAVLSAHDGYNEAQTALDAADYAMRTATVAAECARYSMRMAIAIQGASNDDN